MAVRRSFYALAIMGLALSTPLFSQTTATADGAIESLKPGDFLWAPQVAPFGPVTIIVSLKAQRAYAYRNGVLIGVSSISTGKTGHETPTGLFVILQKEIDHKSSLYDDAPMPYMQRLTWDGIALHAGKLPGYPASHGCIRLPAAFAKLLFGITKLGLTVVVTDDPAAPEISPSPGMLNEGQIDTTTAASDFSWRPGSAPKGPVSIVISGRDRRIVVLRNGVEIGSGAVVIDGDVTSTEAFSLKSSDHTGTHWMRLPLPGQVAAAPPELSAGERARVHLPEAFRLKILGVLKPGATLLVTRDSLNNSGMGEPVSLIDANDN
ncbi:L,D-transpeptidase [soil metagenome]